jgi:hypothetical protein
MGRRVLKKLTWASLLFAVLCLLVAAPAEADSLLYDNGPVNGTFDALLIGAGGYQPLSDSFTVGGNSTLTVAQVGLWVPSGNTPTSVDWAIGTVAGGSDIASGTSTFSNQTNEFSNGGFDIWRSSLDIGGSMAAGTYWFSLQNGTESGGVALYWDMNNGPSTAFVNGQNVVDFCSQFGGTTCSESFQIYDSGPAPTPEPSSFLLLGTGLMALAGVLRRCSHL